VATVKFGGGGDCGVGLFSGVGLGHLVPVRGHLNASDIVDNTALCGMGLFYSSMTIRQDP